MVELITFNNITTIILDSFISHIHQQKLLCLRFKYAYLHGNITITPNHIFINFHVFIFIEASFKDQISKKIIIFSSLFLSLMNFLYLFISFFFFSILNNKILLQLTQ